MEKQYKCAEDMANAYANNLLDDFTYNEKQAIKVAMRIGFNMGASYQRAIDGRWHDVSNIPDEGTHSVYTYDDDGSYGIMYTDNWVLNATEQGVVKWCYLPQYKE